MRLKKKSQTFKTLGILAPAVTLSSVLSGSVARAAGAITKLAAA